MRRNESSRRRAHQGRAKKGKRKKKEKEEGIKKKGEKERDQAWIRYELPGLIMRIIHGIFMKQRAKTVPRYLRFISVVGSLARNKP